MIPNIAWWRHRVSELESQVRELTGERDNYKFADEAHSKHLQEHIDLLQERSEELVRLRDTVEKLREVLVYFEDEAISSCPAEFVSYDRAEKFAEKVRFVLSDMRKGSSGAAPSSTEAKS